MKAFSLILFLNLLPSGTYTISEKEDWNLIHEKDEIKVFTRDVEDSNLKELKMTFIIRNTTVEEISSILMNTDNYPGWVYRCQEARLLEQSQNTSYDYYQYDFPWPLSDRELISKSTYSRDPHTGEVRIKTQSVKEFPGVDEPQGRVRITHHFNEWIFIQSKKDVHFEYYLNSSPGGSIPTWLVNMALDVGSLNTVKELKKIVSNDN